MDQALLTFVIFVPFILIIWLANFADRAHAQGTEGTVFAGFSYGLLGLLYLLLILFGLGIQAVGFLGGLGSQRALGAVNQIASLPLLALGLWLPSVIGIILLLPPVRRLFSSVIPLDPASTVHAIALSYSMVVLINLLVTLGFGLRNLAEASVGTQTDLTPSLAAQTLGLSVLALIGVGWLSRRSLISALQRLGVVAPTGGQIVFGLIAGVILALLSIVVEYLLSRVGVRTNEDVSKLTEQLLGPLFKTITGVLFVGITAGIGEEALLRGAIQPRFGLLIASLLFALLHGNYGLSLSTAVVFVIGLILGTIRWRFNTSTSMIVHATYDITLGLITFLNLVPNF